MKTRTGRNRTDVLGSRTPALLGAFLLAVATACSDSTTPLPFSGSQATFAVTSANGAMYPPSVPTVHGTATAVTVDGMIATPTPCYDVSGMSSIAHDTLVVVITGRAKGSGACEQMVGMWHYTLIVNPRPSGVDVVRVVHDGGIGQPTVALQAPLSP